MTRSLCFTKITPTSICVCTRVYVRAFPDRQDEVVYYDAFESADDITEEDAEEREELRRLQAGARQLEARRGRIIAKRSYLRNKRVRLCTWPWLKFYFDPFFPRLLCCMNARCFADHCLCFAPAGGLRVQPRSEAAETSKRPQGFRVPAAVPGRRLPYNDVTVGLCCLVALPP